MLLKFSDQRLRFYRHVHDTSAFPVGTLVHIIQCKNSYSLRLRAAALRNLVCDAPLEVTKDAPYAAARRLTRAHYGI